MLLKIFLITLLACALVQARPSTQPSIFEEFDNAKKGIQNASADGLAHLPENLEDAVIDTLTENLNRFKQIGRDFEWGVGAGLNSAVGSLMSVFTTPLRIGLKTTGKVG